MHYTHNTWQFFFSYKNGKTDLTNERNSKLFLKFFFILQLECTFTYLQNYEMFTHYWVEFSISYPETDTN